MPPGGCSQLHMSAHLCINAQGGPLVGARQLRPHPAWEADLMLELRLKLCYTLLQLQHLCLKGTLTVAAQPPWRRRHVWRHEVHAELLERVDPSHLLLQQWQLDQVEVFVEVMELVQVLLLHAHARFQQPRPPIGVGKDDLVDDDVVRVDFIFCQLLHQALRFIQRQKLGDAHAHKRCQVRVLELFVDLLHNVQHALHFPEKLLRDVALCAAAQHAADLAHHAAHRALQAYQFVQALLKDVGEVEQPQRMSGGSRVEDDRAVVQRLHLLHDLRK
mmetsp:Transcript_41437/g.123802  ORF Transcript_41437/g.123802 Transcript_41437/m.123802 type:complete len:274 (+) Transcript_41437:108-929(+)